MAEPFIGQIQSFGFNFAPRNWAFCAGQIMPISQNTALFSLIGTYYGGNGTTTYALPDLRGRAPISQGQGPGLSDYSIGESFGRTQTTLLNSNMPSHTHALNANSGSGANLSPANGFLAAGVDPTAGQDVNVYSPTANTTMNPQAVGLSGGSVPFDITAPRLTINFCIALFGIFPSRN